MIINRYPVETNVGNYPRSYVVAIWRHFR